MATTGAGGDNATDSGTDPSDPTAHPTLIDSVDLPALTADDIGAIGNAIEGVMEGSIATDLRSKFEHCTHIRVPFTEVTLALIKPDALKAGYERDVRYAIHSNGFIIIHEAVVQLTTVRAGLLYEEHRGKPWFDRLVRYVSSAPMRAFVLGRHQAARAWNVIVGPTDPNVARRESPHSLRARFGKDIMRNGVHGSFNAEAGRKEVKLLFPSVMLDPVAEPPQARQYFEKHLKRTLIHGLTALAKTKPCIQPNVVIRWFADWLQKNNPNSPYVDGKRHVEVEWDVRVHSCTVAAG